ncbi:MAG: serine/threonine protein kinase [Planctomycetes bacterium]|nr:serine/threonine protein kinase [Planctomycetota bacterium]
MDAPDPAPPSADAPDEVEELLAPVVELPTADEQLAALDGLCASRPELAATLHARFELWQRLATSSALGESTPVRFGDYELLHPLGSGGMGVVWLARQSKGGVERIVALKMIRQRGLFSAEARERFRREAQAALRVDHPALCPVYDVGEVEGTPFLAMRNVPGRTLADHLAEARHAGTPLELPARPSSGETSTATHTPTGRIGSRRRLETILRYIEAVARALHVAHEAGLVHRDIKPGNLMVTPEGDPVVLDFGLVRDASEAESSLTLTGQPIGTPSYMAPEQIEPRGRRIDRSTDIHALGATLFECLTLAPPFHAETRDALYLKVLHEPAPRLRRIDRTAPRDLEVVLETALRKEPERRYATALDFAEDLRRLRELQPILARPTGPLLRAGLWARRNPLVSAFVVLLLVSQVLLGWQVHRTSESIERERQARTQAELEAQAKERALSRAEMNLAAARSAVEELMITARERLSDVPGSEDVREALLERSLGFYRAMLDREGDDRGVRLDVARGRVASGELLLELGRVGESAEDLSRGIASLRELDAEHPSATTRSTLASGLLALARIAMASDDVGVAEERARDAVAARRSSLALLDHPHTRLALSGDLRALAQTLRDQGRIDDAVATAHDALAELDAIGDDTDEQQRERAAASRAATWTELGRLERIRNDEAAAAAAFDASIAVYRELTAGRRPFRGYRNGLAAQLLARAMLEQRESHADEARLRILEAIDVLEQLQREFPSNLTYAQNLATALNNLYTVERQRGDQDAARRALERSRDVLRGLCAASGGDPTGVQELALARCSFNLGNLTRGDGTVAEALQHYRDAVGTLEPIAADSRSIEVRRLFGNALENTAVCLAILGESDQSDHMFERALAEAREVCAMQPESASARRDRSRLLHNTAIRLLEQAQHEAACDRLAAALDDRMALADANPRQPRYEFDVLATAAMLAETRADDGANGAALAREIVDRLSGFEPQRRERSMQSSRACTDLAALLEGDRATRAATRRHDRGPSSGSARPGACSSPSSSSHR